MDERTAAAYLAIGVASLRTVLGRAGVRPVNLGLRAKRWRRGDLDELLARLPPAGIAKADSCTSESEGVDCALQAVERRIAERSRKAAQPRKRP